jgi:hypothetical protein
MAAKETGWKAVQGAESLRQIEQEPEKMPFPGAGRVEKSATAPYLTGSDGATMCEKSADSGDR